MCLSFNHLQINGEYSKQITMAFSTYGIYTVVKNLNDFPAPVAGVITLPNNTTWIIIGAVNIGSNVIACQNATILGESNVISSITSSSATTAVITCTGSLAVRTIALNCSGAANVFACNGTGTSTVLLNQVIIDGCKVGTMQNQAYLIMHTCIITNITGGLTLDGAWTSLIIESSTFSTVTSGVTILTIPSTASFTSRIRMTATFSVATGATAINLSTSATLLTESYIAHLCQFRGLGTYLTGVQPDDSKALFKLCRGVNNSSTIGQYYMTNNATATTNPGLGIFAKIAGTTTVDAIERFTHTNNRLTYTGMQTQRFLVFVLASITTNSGNEVAVRVAKNGTTIASSENSVTAAGATTFIQVGCQVYITLATNDYIEAFTANTSSGGNNVTVRFLNVAVNAIS